MTSLFFPHFPATAVQLALHTTHDVIVHHAGRVIACTELASEGGVKYGDSIQRAVQLMPKSIVTDRRIAAEHAMWEWIAERCYRVSMLVEPLPRNMMLVESDDALAMREVVQLTGACAGMAPTSTLAVLAAVHGKPRVMRVVKKEQVGGFLRKWPVQLLQVLGFGEEMIEKLLLFGLATLDKLQALTQHHLHVQFGDAGRTLYALMARIQNTDTVAVYRQPEIISHTIHLESPSREPMYLKPILNVVLEHVHRQLDKKLCSALEVVTHDRKTGALIRANRILKKPSNDYRYLHTVSTTLLDQVIGPQLYCQALTLNLRGIHLPIPEQLSLFSHTADIQAIVELIQHRYPDVMKMITVVDADAYLPEKAYRQY